jgi:vacuolar-type H+-ATPase subunit H
VNDYGKPQNDMAEQDEQAHELIEQLNLMETVDRRITPKHVAKRFRELLDDTGDNDLPDSATAAITAARGAAAEIIADAQQKAKSSADELQHAQEAVAAARRQAEQIVAEARAEADKALELAVKMVRDARDQAEQIIGEARSEAEQITISAMTRTSAGQPLGFDPADTIASMASPADDEARFGHTLQEAGHHSQIAPSGHTPRQFRASEVPDPGTTAVATVEAEPLLTPAEVATMFHVEIKTVTRWAKAGKLTSIRTLGWGRRYRETEVRALLAGIPQQRSE